VLIIVGGCGDVGRSIATRLAANERDDVVVIDSDPRSFDRLSTTFNGETVVGSITDRDVLEQAGIAEADGLIAVTRSDNTNLMAAQMAKRLYRVPRTVARLFNPENESLYRKLDVPHVSSTEVVAKLFLNEFLTDALPLHVAFEDEDVAVSDLVLDSGAHGMTVEEFEAVGGIRLTAVLRDGTVLLPVGLDRLRVGDVVTAAVRTTTAAALAGLVHSPERAPATDGED